MSRPAKRGLFYFFQHNTKKVIEKKGVKKPMPTKLCESCKAGHQEFEILQMPMPKVTEFLEKLYIDIENSY